MISSPRMAPTVTQGDIDMKHTMLPWVIVEEDMEEDIYYYIKDESYYTVVDPELGIAKYEDADFIVRACNAHYDLVAACDAALAYKEALGRRVVNGSISIIETGGAVAMGDDLDSLFDEWLSKAKKALAKAKGDKS